MDKFVLWAMLVFISIASFAERSVPFPARVQDRSTLNRVADISQAEPLDCTLAAGDQVNVVGQASWRNTDKYVSRVEVESGRCRGMSGWIVTSRLQTE